MLLIYSLFTILLKDDRTLLLLEYILSAIGQALYYALNKNLSQ
jgi:hypothetical protein